MIKNKRGALDRSDRFDGNMLWMLWQQLQRAEQRRARRRRNAVRLLFFPSGQSTKWKEKSTLRTRFMARYLVKIPVVSMSGFIHSLSLCVRGESDTHKIYRGRFFFRFRCHHRIQRHWKVDLRCLRHSLARSFERRERKLTVSRFCFS